MKTRSALVCCSVLVLVLQASMCQASRPQTSRLLLADVILAAGDGCVSGDMCSKGDGTAAECPIAAGSTVCPPLAAGVPCKARDVCKSSIVPTGVDTGKPLTTTVCPADPDSSNGTCPFIPAEETCSQFDLCATGATSSVLCPISGPNKVATCPSLQSGASCAGLQVTGPCPNTQECSTAPPVPISSPNFLSLYAQTGTAGLCVAPKAAGGTCTSGRDYCQNQPENEASTWCPAGPCRLARPGSTCSSTGTIDRCYNGGANPNGAPCPPGGPCPVVGPNLKCFAGDACTGTGPTGQVCNAVGAAEGQCVDISKAAGIQCSDVATAPGATNPTVLDYCRVKTPNSIGDFVTSAVACPSVIKTCPLVPAGQACFSDTADKCSNGDSGTDCPEEDVAADTEDPTVERTANTCPSLATNSACFLGDKCLSPNVYCSATGNNATTKGKCLLTIAAGLACAATDICTPIGAGLPATACPASQVCPPIPAGAPCTVATIADDYSLVNGINGRASAAQTDMCFNGNADPAKAMTKCPSTGTASTQLCPRLTTGLSCSANDLCVKGAKCLNGKCYPNNKVFASPPPPNSPPPAQAAAVLSNATEVPAVKSVVTFPDFDLAAFTKTEETKFCDTVEAAIAKRSNGATSVCTVTGVSGGSVSVANTVAFTGASGAEAAQADLFNFLKQSPASSLQDVFGSTYGSATVAGVESTTTTNPNTETETKTSGAGAVGMAWTVGVALMISALVLTV